MTTTKQRTILIIEDERPLLKVIQDKFEKGGDRVITSRNVERAFATDIAEGPLGTISLSSIERALSHLADLGKVDAIWLDHNLLGTENGVDFVIRLKANGGQWKTIPIFVVSNAADETVKAAYAKLGVHQYYVKAEHKLEDIVKDVRASFART